MRKERTDRRGRITGRAALILAGVLAAGTVLAGCASGPASAEAPAPAAPATTTIIQEEAQMTKSVTVSGTGAIVLVPDRAEISAGVMTEATKATDAQTRNAEAVNALLAALTEMGVPESDIQTENYSFYPRYDYNQGGIITGYQVQTMLSIKNRSIDEVGAILTELVNAGANQSGGVRFTCSNYAEAYAQALEAAVADARAKAEVLAAASGATLGDILEMREGYQDVTYRNQSDYSGVFAMAKEEAAMDMAVMPGEAAINAQVSVQFELR